MAVMPKQAITITTRAVFGPAMAALNDRQRSFVVAHNNAGQTNATESARAAGYKNSEYLHLQAWQLLHNPKIQAALLEDNLSRLAGGLSKRIAKIEQIADTPGHRKEYEANTFLARHAGLIETTRVEHTGTVTLSFEQKLEQLKELSIAAGEDPAKALDEFKDYIDVTPEQVEWPGEY